MGTMTGFIDQIAGLTDARDRDALEYTLASVMFGLTGANSLSMWRVAPRDDGPELRCCVSLGSEHCAKCEGPQCSLRGGGVKPLQAEPALAACYKTKRHLRARLDACGLYRDVFPVANGHGVVRLVEILRAAPMCEDEERLVFGLLRIYRNHLGILDYGDCDDLTGLFNRRTFDDKFRALVSPKQGLRRTAPSKPRRAGDETRGAHLAMIDLDFFKRVNDRFGHPYGDEALVLLARLLSEGFRDTDRLFRFGGDEFLVLLPGADSTAAAAALERFRVSVENFDFPRAGRLTVSIGYTAARKSDSGADAIARADQALYAAKAQGRNRVCCFEALADGAVAATG